MGRPIAFDNASIGRLVPMGAIALLEPPVNTSPIAPPSPSSPSASAPRALAPPLHVADPAGPAGCRRMSSYSFESGAVKFGDAPNSHVLFTFRRQRNILQRDFTVELQFRTFYPSGMLYLVPGSGGGGGGGSGRQRQYLAAYLLDGILQVIYKGRNKLEVSLPNTYNDGVWHTVSWKCSVKIICFVDDLFSPPTSLLFYTLSIFLTAGEIEERRADFNLDCGQ